MKTRLLSSALLCAICFCALAWWPSAASAGNSSIEATVQSYGDLSMFYQALVTTGVINELHENEEYTIFAPTNAAFAQINRETYPCFYAEQCRPGIAALLRNHIVKGHHDLADLTTYGRIQTMGSRSLHIEQQYVNDYTVDDQKIISTHETSGSLIFRITGVLTSPNELAQFQQVTFTPEAAVTTTTQKTITQRTYNTPSASPYYPSGVMPPSSTGVADDASQTTTVIQTTTTH